MPILRRNFSEMNPARLGLAGLLVLALAALISLKSGAIIEYFTTTSYQADFSEAGGLTGGDPVEVSGLTVGTVDSVTLQGDHVRVAFSVRNGPALAQDTSATIATASALGTKDLTLTSAGEGTLPPGATIPLARTSSPYDLSRILSDLTVKASAINAGQVARAFTTIAGTLQDTPPALRSALTGVRALSQTIASRDGELTGMLTAAAKVSGVLATRSQQVRALITDGDQLLAILYERRAEIAALLANVTAAADQLQGLAADNQAQLGPALHQLRGVLDVLNANSANITASINGLRRYAGGLGEAVGSGPWFYAYLANVAPTNLAPVLPALLGK